MKYILLLIIFGCWCPANAQNSNFGKKRIASVYVSYLTDTENEITLASYTPFNVNFLFSISEKWFTGIYYGRMYQRIDNFNTTSNSIFHKGGFMIRYREVMFKERASMNIDLNLGFSNYSLDPNGDYFIENKNAQFGINALVDFKLYKRFFLSGGFIGHRTLKKGDYGFELLPMVGMNIHF